MDIGEHTVAQQVNKYAVIVTSAINTKFGVYSSDQRLAQTLDTIASIRTRIPGCTIFLLEISGVSKENAAMIAPYANAGVGIALTGGAGAAKASITIAKTSTTASEISEPVIVNIPKLLTAGKIDKHHVLPQQFLPWFVKRGIPNIDDYCIQLSKKTHLKGVHGNGNGAQMPGKWNQLWEDFIEQNPNASPSEIFYHAESLLKRFGLEHLPFVKY